MTRCKLCDRTIYQTPDQIFVDHGDFFLCLACEAKADTVLVE